MSKYKEYVDSGIWWLGEIPSHWKIRKSKFIWKEVDKRSELGSEQLLSVSQYDGVRESTETSRSESLKGYKIVENDNLVINIMLAWLGGLGVSQCQGIVSPAYCVYKLTEDINPRYLHHLYRTPLYLAEFTRHSTGIVPSRWRMYTDDFGQVLTLLPPIEEQNAIVEYLDNATLKIDEAIAQQQKMIDLLNERKQIIINKAVTKGLNPDAEMKESGLDWLGLIPSHWSVIKVRNLIEKNRDGIKIGPFGSSLTGKVEMDLPFKVYGQWNISSDDFTAGKNFVSKGTFNALASYIVNSGDILISMMGTIGKCAIVPNDIVPGIMDSHVIKVRLNHNVITNRFFRYAYDKDFCKCTFDSIQVLKKGSIMDGLNSSIVKDIPLAIPPTIEEQNQISDYIEKISNPINNAVKSCNRLIELLREKKNILINDVVTGKIKI